MNAHMEGPTMEDPASAPAHSSSAAAAAAGPPAGVPLPSASSSSSSSSTAAPAADEEEAPLIVARFPSARDLESARVDEGDMRRMRPEVQRFYRKQNRAIADLLEMEEVRDLPWTPEGGGAEPAAADAALRKRVRTAVTVSLAVNVVLLVLKVMAVVASGSLAVLASATDSLLDLLSGALMFALARAVHRRNPYLYPVSKARLEPLGVIVFAVVTGMTSLYVLQGALHELIDGLADGDPALVTIDVFTLAAVGTTVCAKVALYVFCKAVAPESAAVGALAQDHRNDVVTNLAGAAAACVAGYYRSLWFADPVGAILLSAYVIVTWVGAGREQVAALVGQSASPRFISCLVYMVAHHDARIRRVDKVLAYHFGARFIVEVDVVLPEDMPLRVSHDIGESLEMKIEQLATVERAFVHNDFECEHSPEHKRC